MRPCFAALLFGVFFFSLLVVVVVVLVAAAGWAGVYRSFCPFTLVVGDFAHFNVDGGFFFVS